MSVWFDRFNRDYFQKALPVPAFVLSKGRTQLGKFSCKYAVMHKRPKECKIALSTYYEMSERQAANVLLHEMIHYYIAYTGVKDTAPHGEVFCSIANVLNKKYGWKISVSTSTAGWKVAEGSKVRQKRVGVYLILAAETSDGIYFLSVVTPSYARELDDSLKKSREIRHYAWYISQDSYFSDFPKVRSLRGRRVTAEVFQEKTSAAKPFSL